MQELEWITYDGEQLALIIRGGYQPEKTHFVTPEQFKQQVGFIVYGRGTAIEAHIHKPHTRTIQGTSEVLIVRKGKVEAFFFSRQKSLVTKCILLKDDVLLLIAGGHAFRMVDDSILLEIKQGPFLGVDDKDRFTWSDQ